jgi:hypothetical protein
MKKPKPLICIGILCALAAAGLFFLMHVITGQPTDENGPHGPGERLQSVYEIDWTLDPDGRTLTARQHVDYVNAETVPLTEVYFHLYPNYFATEESAPFEEAEMKNAYPNGFSAGRVVFSRIEADGKQADYSIEGDAGGIMYIRLAGPLEPGAHVSCEFEYEVTLPECVGRFGAGDDTIQLCNAYPIAAVYDDEGWNLDPYYAVGDPFYSDVSNYTVRITCPPEYTVTGSGQRSKLETGGGTTSHTFACPDVRDVAFVAGKRLRPVSAEAAGARVTSWHYSDEAAGKAALRSACDAVEVFSDIFGRYPYPELNVIESDLYYGGMEYPNAVLITDRLYRQGARDTLEYVIVHEVAHQWWYGVVGSDQIDDPWLDEALTEFSTLLFYRERYGETRFRQVYEKRIGLSLTLFDYAVSEPKPVGLKTSEAGDNMWYTVVVYKQGARMFRDLHEKMGDDAFKSSLKAYYQNMYLGNAAPSDLYSALNGATGTDWSGFIYAYLIGRPAP